MDPDLTGNAFKRFVRRRGLSRDRPDSNDYPELPGIGSSTGVGTSAGVGGSASSGAHLYYDDDKEDGIMSQPYMPQHRASSTYVRPRDMHGQHRAGANYPHAEGNIRRTQSQADNANPQSPTSTPRRQRKQEDEGTSSVRQYHCEYCNLQFGRKHHKERHVANIHRHEKPYVCNICAHPFHQKPNLDRHRATVHADVTPFQCTICSANFHRRSQLKTHVQTVHDRSRRKICGICRMSTSNSFELNEHMRTEHPSSKARQVRGR